MKNERTIKEINGKKILKLRGIVKPGKVIKDKKKYNRKTKHLNEGIENV